MARQTIRCGRSARFCGGLQIDCGRQSPARTACTWQPSCGICSERARTRVRLHEDSGEAACA
eukprot:188145-Rhodomonas_salina.3